MAMNIVGVSRVAFGVGSAVVMLAGCGGSQPPIGAPAAMPQSLVLATRADRSGSWMLPEAKKRTLLYLSGPTAATFIHIQMANS